MQREYPLILPLDECGSAPVSCVGGKARNLGLLLKNGLPVPNGFVVTARAYWDMAISSDLQTRINIIQEIRSSDRMNSMCEEIRETIENYLIPDDLKDQLMVQIEKFSDDTAFAVRSSATAEDLAEASFAGQQDTYLNVRGRDAIFKAIQNCWASLWTFRAASYRQNFNFDDSPALCVVIQQMVDAKSAGVMFTADPTVGTRTRMILNANPGLGEAVVSGRVTPDHIVVDRPSREVIKSEAGDRAIVVNASPKGGIIENSGVPSAHICLSDAEISDLADLADEVESLFGCPQDVEWASDKEGNILLTQSRPITTLYPLLEEGNSFNVDPKVYFCASYAWQGVQAPITPLGLSGLRIATASVISLAGFEPVYSSNHPACFKEIGSRMFLDVTPAMRNDIGKKAWLGFLSTVAPVARDSLLNLGNRPEFSCKKSRHFRFWMRFFRVALNHGALKRYFGGILSPKRAVRKAKELHNIIKSEISSPDPTPYARLSAAESWILKWVGTIWSRVVPLTGAGITLMNLAKRLCSGAAMSDHYESATRAIPGNVTMEMDLALWEVCEMLMQDTKTSSLLDKHPPEKLASLYLSGDLPPKLQENVKCFLERYGCRSVAEIDLGVPRWSDNPTPVFEALCSFRKAAQRGHRPIEQFEEAEQKAVSAINDLGRHHGLKGRIAALLLRRARLLYSCREQAKFYNVFVLSKAREQFALVGQELAKLGLVKDPSDVFFLSLDQVHSALSGSSVSDAVDHQYALYMQEKNRKHVPAVILHDGTDVDSLESQQKRDLGAGLQGTPASPGSVTARVRVLFDPSGASLEEGEILVAPTTDPGWTPLFLTAAGVILEVGGTASHGAVVAREYGIPAVVGVQGACTLLASGDLVTLDGSSGNIILHTDQDQGVT